jgi:hypothetical protein
MVRLPTPLEGHFIVQLPLQYMQIIENGFGRDVLSIGYESSMSNIIDNGFSFESFNDQVFNDSVDEQKQIETRNSAIDAYRIRMTEANEILLRTIPLLLDDKQECDITSTFALLPSIYRANAAITVNSENLKKIIAINDQTIQEMFQEISKILGQIEEDIRKAK